MSDKLELFNTIGKTVVKIGIRGKTLVIYFAIDSQICEARGYKIKTISNKKHTDTPSMLKISSDRDLNCALELINVAMEIHNVEFND